MKRKTNKKEACADANFREIVNDIISRKIRPLLNSHGGDIEIARIDGNDVGFSFTGACKTCPSALLTLEETVDKFLREELGERLGRVYVYMDTDEELLSFARRILNKKQ